MANSMTGIPTIPNTYSIPCNHKEKWRTMVMKFVLKVLQNINFIGRFFLPGTSEPEL
jgi:hypothetical protein